MGRSRHAEAQISRKYEKYPMDTLWGVCWEWIL